MPEFSGYALAGVPASLRAAPLAERRLAPVAGPPDEQARERLAAWRSVSPFDTPGLWERRLAADSLDEDRLLALLAGIAGTGEEPEWMGIVHDSGFLLESAPGVDWELTQINTLSALMAPLLRHGRELLRARLDGLGGMLFGQGQGQGQGVFLEDAFKPLTELVHRMMARTAVVELHEARETGALGEGGSEERFLRFMASYQRAGGRGRLLERYPVLVRQVSVAVRNWVDSTALLAERLVADAGVLGVTSAPVELHIGLGDRHRGGLTVCRVGFGDGLQILYKPRSQAVDAHFQELLRWFNDHGASRRLRTIKVLDRGEYGWVEYVRARQCESREALCDFYHRQGFLLALLHLLRAADFHAENVIAAGDQPVLVDLESLLAPELPLRDTRVTEVEHAMGQLTVSSVLAIGLLPQPAWTAEDGTLVDVSGMGHPVNVTTPTPIPFLVDLGKDTMRIELARKPMELPNHRPVATDVTLDLNEFRQNVLAGFTEAYRICERERRALAGVLEMFRGDRVRVIVRPTMLYEAMLRTALHPSLLRDGCDRDRHLDALWRESPHLPALDPCIAAERRDLWNNDIPYFSVMTDGDTLLASDDEPVPGIEVRPAMDAVLDRLAAFGPEDYARQHWLVHGTIGLAAAKSHSGRLLPSYSLEPVAQERDAGDPDALVLAALRVGERLRELAVTVDGGAQWFGVNATGDGDWSLGRLRPDLFNGLSGIALFLAHLGALTGDTRHTDLARAALNTALAQTGRGLLGRELGMAGYGGVAYVLSHLAALWQEDRLLGHAMNLLEPLSALIEADREYDVVGGCAGVLAGLDSLYALSPEPRVREVMDKAGRHLLNSRMGAGWLSESLRGQAGRPISGFSHGMGGMGWALGRAGEVLSEGAYVRAGADAIRYEQQSFDPARGTFAELRDHSGFEFAEDTPPAAFWCYGAMGIGLSRVLSSGWLTGPLVEAEIDAALAATRAHGFGLSQCLCHGDFGNIELLLQVAALRDDPGLGREAVALAHASAARREWVCGTVSEVQVPGLMTGLAGIGYGMLRVARPDRVPAVIALERPSTAV
ncbi:type 2 lanthipeptide synthetase LanM family protein [Nonomuraea typhae]|uniref:Type 2 lanthipeptide synthetase LanM family protein n=1 Tax=Nonomuraea typhae TaxID=2603600 RepID=A0ABW7YPM6_9ACTN